MNRVVAIVLVSWSLVLAPMFCLAGVLKHDCDGLCPEASGETSQHDGGSSCGHEAECHADPCSNLVAPARNSAPVEYVPVGATATCDIPASWSVSVVFPILTAERSFSLHHLSGRPFADRGLPLLI